MGLQVGLGSHSPAPPQQSYRRCLESQASTGKKKIALYLSAKRQWSGMQTGRVRGDVGLRFFPLSFKDSLDQIMSVGNPSPISVS